MVTIAITGGTGSFGQACVNKLLKSAQINGIDKIIIYSRDEQKQEKMARRFNNDKLRFFIGDVRDAERAKMALYGCHFVIHAAALKIVPAGEYNPFEFVKTNILGTQNVLNAMDMWRTRFIMLSTDKAVNPVNLYGSTKLAAEKLVLAHNNVHGEYGPQCAVVRYGNVANSNGSVIPVFAEYYAAGKPLPITSKEMTRYYITLEDAVDFVLNNLFNYSNDLTGKVFIPKMPSFKITDLAKAFGGKTEIVGVRPGEKIHETLDGITHSCDNDTWLTVAQLRQQLKQMGHIHEWKWNKKDLRYTYKGDPVIFDRAKKNENRGKKTAERSHSKG